MCRRQSKCCERGRARGESNAQTGTSAACDGAANEVIAISRDHAQQRGQVHQSSVGRFNSQRRQVTMNGPREG